MNAADNMMGSKRICERVDVEIDCNSMPIPKALCSSTDQSSPDPGSILVSHSTLHLMVLLFQDDAHTELSMQCEHG